MVEFKSLDDGRVQLTSPFTEDIWIGPGITDSVRIEIGFKTDGASIPRWVWPIVGPPIRSNHFRAAVVHDWLCENAQSYDERLMGDAKFFALLRKYGVPRWKRSVMYLAVRLAGWWTWCHKSRSTRNS